MKILERLIDWVRPTYVNRAQEKLRSNRPAPEELMTLAKQAIEAAVEGDKYHELVLIKGKVQGNVEIFSNEQRAELEELINRLEYQKGLDDAKVLFTRVICGLIEEPEKQTFAQMKMGLQQAYNAQQKQYLQNMGMTNFSQDEKNRVLAGAYMESIEAFRENIQKQPELSPYPYDVLKEAFKPWK